MSQDADPYTIGHSTRSLEGLIEALQHLGERLPGRTPGQPVAAQGRVNGQLGEALEDACLAERVRGRCLTLGVQA